MLKAGNPLIRSASTWASKAVCVGVCFYGQGLVMGTTNGETYNYRDGLQACYPIVHNSLGSIGKLI